jgi:hypothetical protein
METILGFVAGYVAGCRDGHDGVKRLRNSFDAIRNSPEARRMAAEALMIGQATLRRAASGWSISGLSDPVGTVTDMLAHRASGNRAA